MANKSMAYDHCHYTVHQNKHVNCAIAAASTSIHVIPFKNGGIIKEITAGIIGAGTNAASGYGIYNGTTSVGALTVGTSTALSQVSAGLGDITIAAGGYLEIRTLANSATPQAVDLNIEWRPIPGSNVTA